MALLANGTRGFGSVRVKGRRRVPKPERGERGIVSIEVKRAFSKCHDRASELWADSMRRDEIEGSTYHRRG